MRIVPRMRPQAATLFAALLFLAAAPEPAPRPSAPVLGLDVNLAAGTPAAEQQRAFDLVRRTGASLYAMTLSWTSAEPSPGKYELKDITRTARSLRQSGAQLHLDLPLVAGRQRDVPADLDGVAFDDPKLSLRLGKLLDALEPALRDFSTLSLGYEADAYFADKPDELRAYRRLFEGAVNYLSKKVPRLKVGVTTASPTESPAPAVAAALHQKSPVLFYIYSPFESGRPYTQRDPDAIERDWRDLLAASGERPIAFPEVSYSSAPENSSTLEKQAEFVRRMRRLLASADGRRLLFARYVSWRDVPGEPLPSVATELERRRASFFSHRGLESADGAAKPAWRAWVKAGS